MGFDIKKVDFKLPKNLKLWHVAAAAGLTLLVFGGKKLIEIFVQRKRGALTNELYDKIKYHADNHGVPMALALATIDKESGFDVNAYNPECSGSTREYGVRVDYSPFVICKNNKYRRLAILQKRARDKAWFASKWNTAVDKTKPQMWGSFGLCQILPDTAWGYGYKPEWNNDGLFDIDTNLNIGMKILANKWSKYKNAADVRSLYVSGKTVATRAKEDPNWTVNIINKFNSLLSMYESKFNLPTVTRFSSGSKASYNSAKSAIA